MSMETQQEENNEKSKSPLHDLFASINEAILKTQFTAIGQTAIKAQKDVKALVALAKIEKGETRKLLMRAARSVRFLDENTNTFTYYGMVDDLLSKLLNNRNELAKHANSLDEHRKKMLREM